MLADVEMMMVRSRDKGIPQYLHQLKYDYGGEGDEKSLDVKITNIIETNCQNIVKSSLKSAKCIDDLGLEINTRVDQFESQLSLEMKDMHTKFTDLDNELKEFK